jgi:Flp pilus assembly protein TadG
VTAETSSPVERQRATRPGAWALAATRRVGRRFAGDRGGAAAIEFAVVVLPFLILLFGVLELALVFIINISLSNATAYEARQFRVGNLEATGITSTSSSGIQIDLADMKTKICNQIIIIPTATCVNQLQIDVRVLTAFNGTNSENPVSGSTFNTSGLCYYSGGPGDIVEMRVYYLWPLINPLLLTSLGKITSISGASTSSSGNWVLIYDTEVMKTESVPGLTNPGTGC